MADATRACRLQWSERPDRGLWECCDTRARFSPTVAQVLEIEDACAWRVWADRKWTTWRVAPSVADAKAMAERHAPKEVGARG